MKTTDAPPPSHLKLLLDFIELNGNSQSPCFREPALSSFKKVGVARRCGMCGLLVVVNVLDFESDQRKCLPADEALP